MFSHLSFVPTLAFPDWATATITTGVAILKCNWNKIETKKRHEEKVCRLIFQINTTYILTKLSGSLLTIPAKQGALLWPKNLVPHPGGISSWFKHASFALHSKLSKLLVSATSYDWHVPKLPCAFLKHHWKGQFYLSNLKVEFWIALYDKRFY